MKFVRRLWRVYVSDLRSEVDREATFRSVDDDVAGATRRAETGRRLAFVCIGATLCLMFVKFAGDETHVGWAVSALDWLGLHRASLGLTNALRNSEHARLWQ